MLEFQARSEEVMGAVDALREYARKRLLEESGIFGLNENCVANDS